MQNNRDCLRKGQTRKLRPTRRSVSGVYAFRGKSAIQFESTLERDFLIRKEFELDLLDVIPQPVRIPFTKNGLNYTYTPDFLVYYRPGLPYGEYPKPMLVEVKPLAEWREHWRSWLDKWKAAYRYAKDQGWEFHIHDESRIRNQALANIRFLERYKRMHFPEAESRRLIDNISQMGKAQFHDILALHFMGICSAESISHIWHLLATRQLDCDIFQPLNDFTELWVPTNE